MTDNIAYPSAEIVDLYTRRWEIELGYLLYLIDVLPIVTFLTFA